MRIFISSFLPFLVQLKFARRYCETCGDDVAEQLAPSLAKVRLSPSRVFYCCSLIPLCFFELLHAHTLQLLPLARQMQHEQQVSYFVLNFLFVAFSSQRLSEKSFELLSGDRF